LTNSRIHEDWRRYHRLPPVRSRGKKVDDQLACQETKSTLFDTAVTYLGNEEEDESSEFHHLEKLCRLQSRGSVESSWCNREQYLLVDVWEDRHDKERTAAKEVVVNANNVSVFSMKSARPGANEPAN
jgi:hypothetical protein